MIALSAFHERCETLGIPLLEDENGLKNPSPSDAFAVQQYTKSMHMLRQRLTHGEQSQTITLLSCVMFVCLEFLRGNKVSAITHLRSGLEIIRAQIPSVPPRNNLQENLTNPSLIEGNLIPLFSRLSVLQSMYGQPRSSEYGPSDQGPFLELLDVNMGPEQFFFADLNEARVSAINVFNSTLRLSFLIDYNHFPDEEAMWATQANLLSQAQNWAEALEMLMTTVSDDHLPYSQLLQAHNYMAQIWINGAPDRSECAWDKHFALYERVHDCCLPLIEHLESIATKQPSFTIDLGILSTLFFAAFKCRHRTLRRKFCNLMRRAPRREGLWKAEEIVRVSEKIIQVEEESIADKQDTSLLPPEECRVYDVDIQVRTLRDPGRQFIRLRMKPADSSEFVWRTEHIRW